MRNIKKKVEKINSQSFQIFMRMLQNFMFRWIPSFKKTNTDTFCFFFYLRAKSQNEICSTCCHPWANFAARSPSHACQSALLLQKDTKRSQLSRPSRGSNWPDKDGCKRPGSLLGWEGMWDDLLLQLQRIALLPKVRKWNHKVYGYEMYA